MTSMEEVDDMVSALPRYSREREILERMLNTQSAYASVDENGRIVLSQKLRDKAGISANATFAGMGDKFQIWDPELYEADMEAMDDELDERGDEEDPFALLDRIRSEG